MEVSFFFKKNAATGQWQQSKNYTVFAEAMKEREAAFNSMDYTDVSPVMHGYIDEQETVNNETEFKDAFKTMFGFDIFDFEEAYEKTEGIGTILHSLKEAREVKAAYEYLKEKFGWKENFSIFKYGDVIGRGSDGYAVENDNIFPIPGIEKIE
jgi:hypothetical protein